MKKLIEIKYGSHLYGTNTENSDLDIKGIYLPEARDIVLGRIKETIQIKRPKAHGERNTKDDIDVEYVSLCRFLRLLAEGQTMALDMLFASFSTHMPPFETVTPEFAGVWNVIMANKKRLINKNVNAFVGYARQQAAKYGIKGSRMDALKRTMEALAPLPDYDRLKEHIPEINKLIAESKELVSLEKDPLITGVDCKGPNGEKVPHLQVCNRKVPLHATVKHAKQIFGRILDEYGARSRMANLEGGIDWKALSHAVRVNSEAIELLRTGHITMPRPDAELLKQIKKGELPYEQVATLIEQGLADLMKAKEESTLRDAPDQEWIDNFLAQVYTGIIRGEI